MLDSADTSSEVSAFRAEVDRLATCALVSPPICEEASPATVALVSAAADSPATWVVVSACRLALPSLATPAAVRPAICAVLRFWTWSVDSSWAVVEDSPLSCAADRARTWVLDSADTSSEVSAFRAAVDRLATCTLVSPPICEEARPATVALVSAAAARRPTWVVVRA